LRALRIVSLRIVCLAWLRIGVEQRVHRLAVSRAGCAKPNSMAQKGAMG
jgi:hypothetical protein